MSNTITASGTTYAVRGTVVDSSQRGVAGLTVTAYDKDLFASDFLGVAETDASGVFVIRFDLSHFASIVDRKPDLYFTVEDGGTELLNTRDQVLDDIGPDMAPIVLTVSLADDKARQEIKTTPAPGWIGGFSTSKKEFAYPKPDLRSLEMLHNLDNIDKLQRQQKVLWPEFSWNSEPGAADPKRCYQMFAPDISRLGYTNEGRVYAIICPQQGASSPSLGTMNVEVTVTGNRGWANEDDKTLAGDMTVEGRIWFSPSALEGPLVKTLWHHFKSSNLPFPSTKANAIRVQTHLPGNPEQPIFPLLKGETADFPIPAFARHADEAWTVGHLDVEIGPIKKTNIDKVDAFNQMILDVFNFGAGNMLLKGNVLSWNVWFTAPELVDQKEWAAHAEKWRKSIDADHGSPDGEGSIARHFDGTPFKPLEERAAEEMTMILAWLREHL